MKIATTIGEVNQFTDVPAKAVALYEGTGFRWLDYSFYNVLYPGSPYLNGEEWKKEVWAAAETAEKIGVRFIQAHSPNYNPFQPGVDQDAGVKATLHSIEACGMLGIPNIVVHTGFTPQIPYAPENEQRYFAENDRFIRQLYPAMEKYNVRVCIENSAEANMGTQFFFMTAEEMNRYIDHCGHPLLGACWDIGHANMRGADQYKELMTLGKNLHALHIQDNDGRGDMHIMPYFGTVNLDAVMRALVDLNYREAFSFETDNALNPADRGTGPLGMPPIEVKKAQLALLYQIGATALRAYGCAEE